MLASHSNIYIPPETWFLLPLVEQFPLTESLSTEQVEEVLAIITTHYRWPDLDIDASFMSAKIKVLASPTLRDICDIVYSTLAKRERKPRWGDKTPPYIEIVPQLMEVYPNSRFIHLVRDGHDVTKSFQAKGWYGPSLHSNTVEWKKALESAAGLVEKRFKDHVITVRYEDLVLHTETELCRICDFLGETFETGMLEQQTQSERLIPERERSIHEKITRKPVETDIYRWKRELSIFEILVVEAYIFKELDQAGYERMFKSSAWVPLFSLTRLICDGKTSILKSMVQLRATLTGNTNPKGIDA